jgi:multisubunit Na+/H+ antiporter MnhC subunit
MFAAAIYLMLSGLLIKFVFGLALIGNAINLLLFTAGRLIHADPPLIAPGQSTISGPVANALPQALILTAIVIGFAMTTFILVLLHRTYSRTGTLDVDNPIFLKEIAETPQDDTLESFSRQEGP